MRASSRVRAFTPARTRRAHRRPESSSMRRRKGLVLRRTHVGERQHATCAAEDLVGPALRCQLNREPDARIDARIVQRREDSSKFLDRVARAVRPRKWIARSLRPFFPQLLAPIVGWTCGVRGDTRFLAQLRSNTEQRINDLLGYANAELSSLGAQVRIVRRTPERADVSKLERALPGHFCCPSSRLFIFMARAGSLRRCRRNWPKLAHGCRTSCRAAGNRSSSRG